MDIARWEAFVEREQARGVNLAILIGGEPTLYLDRVEAFYKRLPTFCATNGLIKVPRDRFPDMMVGISLWGDEEDEKLLRGKDTFAVSSRNYAGDPVHLLSLHHHPPAARTDGTRHPEDRRCRASRSICSFCPMMRGWTGFPGRPPSLRISAPRWTPCSTAIPETVISCRYYHEIITTGRMLGRPFGWNECPSVTEPLDDRNPRPKRLIRFIRWAADLEDDAPLLHVGHPGLHDLQGRRGPHELGDGQQKGAYAFGEGSPELDRGLRDVCQALPVHSLVEHEVAIHSPLDLTMNSMA